MPRYIVKLDGKYLEWSTVVDAPVTYGKTLEEFREHYQDAYGRSSMREFDERMARVEAKGTSSRDHESADDTVSYNRAGPRETCISVEEIIERYVRTERGSDG